MRPHLLEWQRDGYREYHRNRSTLWVHLFAVPAFIVATLSLVLSLVTVSWVSAVSALVGMALSFFVQGLTHRREPTPSIPFDGVGDAISRIFAEQFITFPRFLVSGRWWVALRATSQLHGSAH